MGSHGCRRVFISARTVLHRSVCFPSFLQASQVIRQLVDREGQKYIIVVEHDLSILDYLSDFICVLYGVPSAYGVVTMPFSVRDGINIFLAGFIPTENMRFRSEALTFRVAEPMEETKGSGRTHGYGA